ncbi:MULTISPECIES: helix-turn-helix transcriptional regulator [Salinibaculum]|uniref:helix-turn-helix transcriptional regulator n=1 Tax=Salinibaculum TaxID=2732368 RepID=UPI0030CCFA29
MGRSLNAGETVVTLGIVAAVVGAVLLPALTGGAVAQGGQPETDNTVTRLDVAADGSARWTIQIRTRLDTDQRVEEYTAFQARFRNDTASYLDPFRQRMRGVVANAANATGREMRAVNFTATTQIQEVPRRWGVVTYEFTWTNLAAQSNEGLAVGDLFQGGFFLASQDTLEVEAPDGYDVATVNPAPAEQRDGVVTWVGREDFPDERPRVVFAPATDDATPTGGATTAAGPTPTVTPSSPAGGGGPGTMVGALVALGIGGLLAYTAYRRRSRRRGDDDPDTPAAAPDRDPSAAASGTDQSETESAGTEPAGAAVLTDEERVESLIDANGGRMRQAAIAEELDWSASKTSRVVGRMADAGTVEKLQLGRENLVSLPDDRE